MKYIDKGGEPPFFIGWKKSDKMCKRGKPNWNRLKSKKKEDLKKRAGSHLLLLRNADQTQ